MGLPLHSRDVGAVERWGRVATRLLCGIAIAGTATSLGCGGSQAQGDAPQAGAAATDPNAPPGLPDVETPRELTAAERLETLDLETAQELVAEIEALWPIDEAEADFEPQSFEEALEILKRDQVNLFPKAIAFLTLQEEADALALHGQIELAWGETYMLLMEILTRLRYDFDQTADKLESQGETTQTDPAKLDWLRGSADELELRVKAFGLVAIDHLAEGFDRAEKVIEMHPDSYLGYRVAADYYRILREWEKFDGMIEKIEATNPKSNGLLFLRAAALFQNEKDRDGAAKLYHQALNNDPQFVRAQAHLLIIQSKIEGTHRELLALEKLNPNHQFVALAGESIKRAFADTQGKTKALSN